MLGPTIPRGLLEAQLTFPEDGSPSVSLCQQGAARQLGYIVRPGVHAEQPCESLEACAHDTMQGRNLGIYHAAEKFI